MSSITTPGLSSRDARDLGLELRIEKGRRAAHRAIGKPQFRAMARDCRKLERREEQIEFGERPSADEGERAADALGEPFQRDGQIRRNDHLERRRREIEDRPVHIEQNGPGRQRNGVDEQFALRNCDF